MSQATISGGSGGAVDPPFSVNVSSINKLNKTNFQSWKEDVTLELRMRGLHRALTDDSVDDQTDLMATLVLQRTVDEEHRVQIRGCQTAKEIMDRLTLSYAQVTAARKYRILNEFFRATKQPGDTINVHIGKLDGMRSSLCDMDIKIEEDIYLATVIGSLPPEFGNVMETWELAAESERTKSKLLAKLLNKEADLQNASEKMSSAMIASRPTRPSIEERKKNSKCSNCGEQGHWYRECPHPPSSNHNKARKREQIGASLVTTLGVISTKQIWVIDSGATDHMANNRDVFSKLVLFDQSRQVYTGNGGKMEVLGVGQVPFVSSVGLTDLVGVLGEVLYIPELSHNLVSVPALAQKGATVAFFGGRCEVEKQKKALIVTADRSNQEWHEVLGHQSQQRIRALFKDNSPHKTTGGKVDCGEPCAIGKAKHVPHPSRDQNLEELEVGQEVHIDTVHIANNKQPYPYYLLCKDRKSEFTFVYPMFKKSDVLEQIEQLIIDFEAGSGKRIMKICCDNGSELVNSAIEGLLRFERIELSTSSPYVSQQNGFVERAVQTINNIARTIWHESKLKETVIIEAIKTAAYLFNRVSTKRSKQTPYERFTGREPTYTNLVRFGEPVQVLQTLGYRRKFDARTEPGFIVGYTIRHNTYRVYIPAKDQVIITPNITLCNNDLKAATPQPGDLEKTSNNSTGFELWFNSKKSQVHSENNNQQGEDTVPSAPDEYLFELDSFENDGQQTSTPEGDREGGATQITGKNGKPFIQPAELQNFFDNFLEGVRNDGIDNPSFELGWNHGPNNLAQIDTTCALTDEQRDESPIQNPAHVPDQEPCTDQTQSHLETTDEVSFQSARGHLEDDREEIRRDGHSLMVQLYDDVSGPTEPSTVEEALEGPFAKYWQEAINNELEAHKINETWEEVPRPANSHTISAKWVFKLKKTSDGLVERYKARLVARGFQQRPGIDFKETYAPVAMMESIRTLLAGAMAKSMDWVQFDVTTAFLNGKIEEQVLMDPPKGIEIDKDHCLKLRKALYGLRQAPKAWSSKFSAVMKDLGLSPLVSDPCIYANPDRSHIIACYVDDGLVFAKTKEECLEIVKKMNDTIRTNIIDGTVFLGIEIIRTKTGILLSQHRYIEDLIEKYKLNHESPLTRISVHVKDMLSKEVSKQDTTKNVSATEYRSAIGALLYLALNTRPDILFVTILLSRFNNDPEDKHWAAVLRLVRYLKYTKTEGLAIKGGTNNIKLIGYSDADWGGNDQDCLSTSGILIKMNDSPIVYRSIRQKRPALSSGNSEYIAANDCAKDLLWIRNLLHELKLSYDKPTMFIDNKGVVQQIRHEKFHRGLKHIAICYRHIEYIYKQGEVNIEHIPTSLQQADILTKVLPGPRNNQIKTYIGITRAETMKSSVIGACTLAVLALSSLSEAKVALDRGDAIIWRKTDMKVPIGWLNFNVDIILPNPCEQVLDIANKLHDGDYSKKTYQRLYDRCSEYKTDQIDPTMRTIIDWTKIKTSKYDGVLTRHRRFIDPISLTIGLVCVSGYGVSAALYFLLPSSPVNTVPILEARVKTLTESANAFTSVGNAHKLSIDDLNRSINSTAQLVEQVRKDLHTTAINAADVAWLSSSTLQKMSRFSALLEAVMISYKKHKKVDLEAIGSLIGMPRLKELDEQQSYWSDVGHFTVDNKESIYFKFSVLARDEETYFAKADPFQFRINETTWLVYNGPSLALHDPRFNCTRGIRDTDNFMFHAQCRTPNYLDPSLQSWTTASKGIDTVQIKQADNYFAVLCPGHNITIAGKNRTCPGWPIKISTASFSIDDFSLEETEETSVRYSGPTAAFQVRPFNDTLESDDTVMTVIETTNGVSFRNNKVHLTSIPEDQLGSASDKISPFSTDRLISWVLGSSTGLVLVAGIAAWFLTSSRGQSPAGQETSETATGEVRSETNVNLNVTNMTADVKPTAEQLQLLATLILGNPNVNRHLYPALSTIPQILQEDPAKEEDSITTDDTVKVEDSDFRGGVSGQS